MVCYGDKGKSADEQKRRDAAPSAKKMFMSPGGPAAAAGSKMSGTQEGRQQDSCRVNKGYVFRFFSWSVMIMSSKINYKIFF